MSGPVETLPMRLPVCGHHGQMELQQPGTPEQAYCGTWYRCSICHSGVLFMSKELSRDLARQVQS